MGKLESLGAGFLLGTFQPEGTVSPEIIKLTRIGFKFYENLRPDFEPLTLNSTDL